MIVFVFQKMADKNPVSMFTLMTLGKQNDLGKVVELPTLDEPLTLEQMAGVDFSDLGKEILFSFNRNGLKKVPVKLTNYGHLMITKRGSKYFLCNPRDGSSVSVGPEKFIFKTNSGEHCFEQLEPDEILNCGGVKVKIYLK